MTKFTAPVKVCSASKITVTNVTFTEADTYTYTIKNTSSSEIAIQNIMLQNYVSKDDVIGGDVAAGGAPIDFEDTDMLAPGATYTGTDFFNRNEEAPESSYPYVIMHFYIKGEQCSVNDDAHYIGLVKVSKPTAVQTKVSANANVVWNSETKSFLVNDWNGNSHAELSYEIFSASGAHVLNGKTFIEQINSINGLKSGMYILYLSDGQQVYSKKILL